MTLEGENYQVNMEPLHSLTDIVIVMINIMISPIQTQKNSGEAIASSIHNSPGIECNNISLI